MIWAIAPRRCHSLLLTHRVFSPATAAPDAPCRIGDRGEVIDDTGHTAQTYGLRSGQWVLVRPDGYVAAVVGTEGLDEALRLSMTEPAI